MEILEILGSVERTIAAFAGILTTMVGLFYTLFRKIDKKVAIIMDYCCGSIANDKVLERLNKIKRHYLCEIKDANCRNAAGEKADAFIEVVAKTLKMYNIDIDSYQAIKNDFESQKAYVRDRICSYFNNELAVECNHAHDELNKAFYAALKKILMPTKNHHKDRFVDACCEHLEKLLETMIRFEV